MSNQPLHFKPFWQTLPSLVRSIMRLPRSCCLCGESISEDLLFCAPCQMNLRACSQIRQIGDRPQNCLILDQLQAAYAYGYPVDVLIRRLKYHGALYLAAPLSHELAQMCASTPVDGIIAIPQSAARWRQRGYNPALEIASRVARHIKRPLWLQGLTRTRETRVQAGLGLIQRQQNVAGVFACTMNVKGLWVAVVDDVSTSGATLSAVARELKAQGARRVSAWVVARTSPPD